MTKDELQHFIMCIRRVLSYNKETGVFIWRESMKNKQVKAGSPSGSVNKDGYITISYRGVVEYAHRLAWLHEFGIVPEFEIDHKNGIRSDNRISNLREVTRSLNNENRDLNDGRGLSVSLGVYFSKQKMKWHARIFVNKRQIHLGFYDTEAEAASAYAKSKEKLHHGFKTGRLLAQQPTFQGGCL